MSLPALIFFFLFALIILAMYIAIRRRLAPIGAISAGGVIGSVMTMMLFSLAQGNVLAQAILVGVVVGGIFSIAAIIIALYFYGNERRNDERRNDERRNDERRNDARRSNNDMRNHDEAAQQTTTG